jgi:hypothetical protein
MIFPKCPLDKTSFFALYYIGLKPAGLERGKEERGPIRDRAGSSALKMAKNVLLERRCCSKSFIE